MPPEGLKAAGPDKGAEALAAARARIERLTALLTESRAKRAEDRATHHAEAARLRQQRLDEKQAKDRRIEHLLAETARLREVVRNQRVTGLARRQERDALLAALAGSDQADPVRLVRSVTGAAIRQGRLGQGLPLAFAMLDLAAPAEVAFSLLAAEFHRRGVAESALALLDRLPPALVAHANLLEAAALLGGRDPARFAAVADLLGDGAAAPPEAWLATLRAFAFARDLDRYRRWRDARSETDALPEALQLGLQELDQWVAKWQGPAPRHATGDRPALGIYAYRSATRTSINIGDQIQSLAMLGQYAQAGLRLVEEDGAPAPLPPEVQAPAGEGPPVQLVVLDRDDPATAAPPGPVWLPVFGWFAHQSFDQAYSLDLPPQIRPLFFSFHVNRAAVLDESMLAVLRHCQPIGCRDHTTVRLLLAHGIRAFFSGCVTLGLGESFGTGAAGAPDAPHYAVSYHMGRIEPPAGAEFVAHNRAPLRFAPFFDTLAEAAELLRRYAVAGRVTTDLLHCYLPCRAMGTPVDFIHPRQADRRFEGLVDITPEEIGQVRANLAIFRGLLRRALAGEPEAALRAAWREAWRGAEARSQAYLAACAVRLAPVGLPAAPVPQPLSAPALAGDRLDLVMCFDRHMAPQVMTTLRSVVAGASRGIRVHFMTRGLDRLRLAPGALPAAHEVVQHDLGDAPAAIGPSGGLQLLSHTTASTMDRLLIPELLGGSRRAVYLDIDVLLRGDIAALHDMPLEGQALAARRSIDAGWRHGVSLYHEIAERLDPAAARDLRSHLFAGGKLDYPCFNAGVLVMALDRLRQERLSQTGWALAARWGLHDQFILNIQARGRFAELPPAWNHFVRQEFVEDPRLVHFTGTTKPWHATYQRFRDEWRGHAPPAPLLQWEPRGESPPEQAEAE